MRVLGMQYSYALAARARGHAGCASRALVARARSSRFLSLLTAADGRRARAALLDLRPKARHAVALAREIEIRAVRARSSGCHRHRHRRARRAGDAQERGDAERRPSHRVKWLWPTL